MNFNDYQNAVAKMPLYDDPILGLVGEVGELVEHVKKSRRPAPKTKPLDRSEVILEAGDVLWYLTRWCSDNNISIEDVANQNIAKLEKRHGLTN